MKFISSILIIFITLVSTNASFSGPFLLWGYENIENIKIPALEAVEEKPLAAIYSEAKAIIVFLRNNTNNLDNKNYPNFKELIGKSNWAYLPQYSLPAEPLDHNSNVEVIPLVGPPSQQDIELTALYHDAVTVYGEGKVLGILANQAENYHVIYKRSPNEDTEQTGTETEENASPTNEAANQNANNEEPMKDDVVNITYKDRDGKAMMYTTLPPVLSLTNDANEVKTIELKHHGLVTFDDRENKGFYRMIIGCKTDEGGKVTLRFKFPVSGGYWSLTSVDVEENGAVTGMNVVGEAPMAPIGFSYACSKPLIFTNGTNKLELNSIQVQPQLSEPNRFSDDYNCIGFTTVPIWSGIFVSFLVLIGTFIGIIALLEVKTPNRFESNRNKQLTINVQE